MRTKLNQNEVNSLLGFKGGSLQLDNNFNIKIHGADYSCTLAKDLASTVGDLASTGGGLKKSKKSKKSKPKPKKSKKTMYKEYLDKKYSKDELLKKCKSLGIKVTTRKNGLIKPIKKETLINKIVKIKFG
jgi:hypothetical protein